MDTSFKDCAPEVFDMSRKIERAIFASNFYLVIASLIVLSASAAVVAAPEAGADEAAGEARTSITRHHVRGGRDKPTDVEETAEDYEVLVTSGDRKGTETRGSFAKPGVGSSDSQSASYDFWIYEADVLLFNDDDLDGYFHGVDLLFDADTIYSAADVYAVLYLSYEGGPWNEYGVTEDFTIFGSSGTDEYVMVTELMSGYPTGSYDLLIELFDAYDGSFLAAFGPDETSELAYLPLEDYNRDAPIEEVQVVVNRGGGGAMDGWLLSALLLILFASAMRKIWRRRNDTLMRIDSPAPCWKEESASRGGPGFSR